MEFNMSAPSAFSSGQAAPPPGWYPDPANAAAQRYWDGSAWTQQIAAGVQPTQPSVPTGLVIGGYVSAVLVPLLGFILGFVAIKKHEGTGTNHGVWIIVTAVSMFVLYFLMLAAAGSSSA
jgi:hypothetical protein